MIKHFCDKCGKEAPYTNKVDIDEVSGLYELCSKCTQYLEAWLRNEVPQKTPIQK